MEKSGVETTNQTQPYIFVDIAAGRTYLFNYLFIYTNQHRKERKSHKSCKS